MISHFIYFKNNNNDFKSSFNQYFIRMRWFGVSYCSVSYFLVIYYRSANTGLSGTCITNSYVQYVNNRITIIMYMLKWQCIE